MCCGRRLDLMIVESSHMQHLTGRQHEDMGIEAFENPGVKTAIVLVRKARACS